jgi:hypothetical protein
MGMAINYQFNIRVGLAKGLMIGCFKAVPMAMFYCETASG